MDGGWIATNEELPPPETPVLAFVHGMDTPIVLEMRWEMCTPMVEGYFEDFLYWDNPHDDGQDYGDRVYAWQQLPENPNLSEMEFKEDVTYKFSNKKGEIFTGKLVKKWNYGLSPRFVGKDGKGKDCHLRLDAVIDPKYGWKFLT